jgi:hypothetical protein
MNIDNVIINYLPVAKPLSMAMERQKKHISLIIYKRKIIAVGQNVFKTHPDTFRLGYRGSDMHSELDAYRKIPKSLRGEKLTLLNFRFRSIVFIPMGSIVRGLTFIGILVNDSISCDFNSWIYLRVEKRSTRLVND